MNYRFFCLLLLLPMLSVDVCALENKSIPNKETDLRYEKLYRHAHCSANNGIEEYLLPDRTRVDCLTDKYAVEYDFVKKRYEAVGQALHYGAVTGAIPKVVLIINKKYQTKQMKYYEQIKQAGDIYGFKVEYITEDILDEVR